MRKRTKMKYAAGALAALVIIVGVALLLVNTQPITGSVVKSAAKSTEPIRIGVINYPGFGPFFIAKEKGFFEKQGVKAEVITTNDPTQAISVLASDNLQMLFSTADMTPVVADAGVEVKEIFVTDIGYGSDGLLVKKDVKSIKDLKGKTVYLSLGTPSHFLLRIIAKEAGLKREDIKLVHMEADQVGAAFVAGQIDYGMSWEPWLSKASKRKDGKVLVSSREKPGIVTDTFIVRTDTLKSRRDDVKAVVRAWFDAIEYWKKNPAEANAIMAKGFGLPVEEFKVQVATVKFLDYKQNLAKYNRSTSLNLYELTDSAVEIFMEDGIMKSKVDAESVIDSTVLKELYRSVD